MKVPFFFDDVVAFNGQRIGHILAEGITFFLERTAAALWVLRCALRRAKVHKGLIESTWIFFVNEFFANCSDFFAGFVLRYVFANAENAADNAQDVSIHGGVGQSEGDGGDGGGGVVADAFERADFIVCAGESAIMAGDDLLRGAVHIACTRVISQSLPYAKYFLFGGVGQRLDVGESVDETQIVVPTLLDAGLLQMISETQIL